MADIDEMIKALLDFRAERDWEQFHNPKDLAVALSIEASELLELFLWKQPNQADVAKVESELADVLSYLLLISHHYGINVRDALMRKLVSNAERYPVGKAKGIATKYTEL